MITDDKWQRPGWPDMLIFVGAGAFAAFYAFAYGICVRFDSSQPQNSMEHDLAGSVDS